MATKRIIVRNTRLEDIPAAIKVEQAAWAPPWPQDCVFTAEHLRSQIEMFPQGQISAFVWEEERGEYVLAGFVTTMLMDYDLKGRPAISWDKITAGGFITNHNPLGNTIFAANLSVSPDYPRSGVSDALMYSVIKLCLELPRQKLMFGSRMPSYCKYADSMSAEEYMWTRRKSGKPLDPEIRMYESAGGQIVALVPNYIPDPESLDYGVLMVFHNPLKWFWRVPLLGKAVSPLVGSVLK